MGKLNIAHHKSYHPYRRDNIERVRRDEEEAARREAVEEGRMMLADSEARMDLLRQRAGLGGTKPKADDMDRLEDPSGAGPSSAAAAGGAGALSTLTSSNGHINFFEDLERQVLIPVYGSARSTRQPKAGVGKEDEKGVALAPSEKDLNPWYVHPEREGKAEEGATDEEKRRRDLQRKSAHDPLTAINSQLAARSSGRPSSSSSSANRNTYSGGPRWPPNASSSTSADPQGQSRPEVAARLARESAERQRALELIARKKREASLGSVTPSTVHGGDRSGEDGYRRYGGYGDVFNRREVEEARR
ncbi:hypothetical protein BD414DRAFT_397401, partial [Trametes punicea]